jgi:hypothetical protein
MRLRGESIQGIIRVKDGKMGRGKLSNVGIEGEKIE